MIIEGVQYGFGELYWRTKPRGVRNDFFAYFKNFYKTFYRTCQKVGKILQKKVAKPNRIFILNKNI